MGYKYCNRNRKNLGILEGLGYERPPEEVKGLSMYPYYELRGDKLVIMGTPDDIDKFLFDDEIENLKIINRPITNYKKLTNSIDPELFCQFKEAAKELFETSSLTPLELKGILDGELFELMSFENSDRKVRGAQYEY